MEADWWTIFFCIGDLHLTITHSATIQIYNSTEQVVIMIDPIYSHHSISAIMIVICDLSCQVPTSNVSGELASSAVMRSSFYDWCSLHLMIVTLVTISWCSQMVFRSSWLTTEFPVPIRILKQGLLSLFSIWNQFKVIYYSTKDNLVKISVYLKWGYQFY